jgi:hypothetical protein
MFVFADDKLSFGIIWNRIKGREVLIAKDKELSFILENLMRLTGTAGQTLILTERLIVRLIG